MKTFFKKKRNLILVSLLTVVGFILHFYNLNWGSPFYFHPDERNIASAVTQLNFPTHMNPRFFAYGSLPIYTIYFIGILTNYFSPYLLSTTPSSIQTVTFSQAILLSRIFSALFATLLIPLIFFLGKRLRKESGGLLAAFFATTSIGFIQFAHYGTFEMWLTFFTTLLFWLCWRYFHKPKSTTLIFLALTFGTLISIKVSSLALLPIPLLTLIAKHGRHYKISINKKNVTWKLKNLMPRPLMLFLLRSCKDVILFSVISIVIYLLTNPYSILDQKDFLSSMHYESSVALGTEPVFYTQNFYNTIPGLYQFLHVYPFIINPLLTLLFIPALLYFFYAVIKYKNKLSALILAFFLIIFFSQAFLFVKWTRYMIPTLPFMYLIIALTITTNVPMNKSHNIAIFKSTKQLFLCISILTCIVFSFSYFKTAFVNPDTRIAAQEFATRTIPTTATILSEPSDLGVLPFQDAFPHFDTFSFYTMDNKSTDATKAKLQQKIAVSQYILIPSQRILQSRMLDQKRYPKGYAFYTSLFNGSLGFHKIYETPCDIFCKITYLGDPIYWWEQTVSVFDRPTVFIFKKNS